MNIIFPILFVLIAVFEVPAILQKKLKRELVVFLVLFVLSFTVSVFFALGFDIPSPIMGIKYLFQNILHISYTGA